MKLLSNPASPFARKVRVAAHELGLADEIELVQIVLTPIQPSTVLNEVNPVGKIPALLLDDGTSLHDSRVIVEYLDHRAGGRLFAARGPARWAALRLASEADGIMEAAILARYERMVRPPEKQFEAWIDGQLGKVERTLDALDREAAGFLDVGIGEIAAACALGYLDFRFAERDWRQGRPALARFYEGFAARPSMQATQPAQP